MLDAKALTAIIDSDKFLDMPLSAQALYFHLVRKADCGGLIYNAKAVKRGVMASDNDMDMLLLNRFIYPYESGVLALSDYPHYDEEDEEMEGDEDGRC